MDLNELIRNFLEAFKLAEKPEIQPDFVLLVRIAVDLRLS